MLDKIEEFIDVIKITEALCEVSQYKIYKAAFAQKIYYIDRIQGSNFDFLSLDINKDGLYELKKANEFVVEYDTILITDDADMIINRMRAEMYGYS